MPRLLAAGPAIVLAATLLVAPAASAQDAPPAPAETPAAAAVPAPPASWLVVDAPDLRLRRPFGPNALFARYLLDRDAAPPREGEELTGERRTPVRWTRVETMDGAVPTESGALAYATVESAEDRVVLATVRGAVALWVNGEPFAGDVYGMGHGPVPVPLRKGVNHLYLSGFRGAPRLTFDSLAAGEGVFPSRFDATVPDVETRDVAGGPADTVDAGIVVVNASRALQRVAVGQTAPDANGTRPVLLLPFMATKVPAQADVRRGDGNPAIEVAAVAEGSRGTAWFELATREGGAARRVTRVSDIDGSVQEYAVLPPAPTVAPVPTRVVLSLHGASVDCLGQAKSYSARPGFWIVCPTNRRPFGFDWQDFGRLDAYEALADATGRFGLPSDRVYLTGHSMGGHGTWHLAANDPDRFRAIAPSAGWASFDTYAGGPRPPSPLSPLWRGADAASDTLTFAANLAPIPTLIVHGTKDDNVPVDQAETMLTALRAAGGSPAIHLEEGAGHWWDGDRAPGADCVDWPGIFELFEKTEPAPAPDTLDWTTADPSVDARHHWLQAVLPLEYGAPVRIRAAWDRAAATCTLTTANARRINVAPPGAERWTAVIDGERLDVAGPNVWFERHPTGWEAKANVQDDRKKPSWSGPLRRGFGRRFAVVIPTRGNDAETIETTARARYDAAVWWIRGNGFWDVALDAEVAAHPERFEGRNLVLYGNSDTNAAWARVLGDDRPVDAGRGWLRVGTRRWSTSSGACFFVRPRADDAFGLVTALADTGPRGCRLAVAHGLFSSGVGYPDFVAWDERALALGDGGVLAAGWFDAFWKLDGREYLSYGGEAVRDGAR